MKFATARPYADPEVAARKLIEIANLVEAVQDGRIHIELLNGPMLVHPGRSGAVCAAKSDKKISFVSYKMSRIKERVHARLTETFTNESDAKICARSRLGIMQEPGRHTQSV